MVDGTIKGLFLRYEPVKEAGVFCGVGAEASWLIFFLIGSDMSAKGGWGMSGIPRVCVQIAQIASSLRGPVNFDD